MSNTVKLKNYSDVMEEGVANAAITPGMLIEQMSTGKYRAHATAGGNVLLMFAVEDEMQGLSIDDDYDADDPVQIWIPGRGDQVNALLANGQTAAIGDFLVSNGDGYLKVLDEQSADSDDAIGTIYGQQIVGKAVEAVDMSGSSGVDPDGRIAVRII
jgi:hypothetical protein